MNGLRTWPEQVRLLATLRVGLGGVIAVVPGLVARPWMGTDADRPATRLALRSLGVRDAAIGAGALLALRHEAPVRGWLEAAAVGDAGDALATLLAWRHLPPAGRALVLGFALAGAGVSRHLAVRAGT